MGICAVFGIDPVKREFDVGSIHRRSVVKGHAALQFERIGQAIVRDFPRLRQPGHDRSVAHKAGQPFENIGIEHLINSPRRSAGRVQMRWLKLHRDGDVVFRGDAGGHQRGSAGA